MIESPSSQSLQALLQALSTGTDEPSAAYLKLRGTLIRFFQIKGEIEPESACDETIDRVALKLSQGIQIDDVTKYSFGVARFVFLERIRSAEKNRKAAQNFYEDRTTDHEKEDSAGYSAERECFDSLTFGDQDLLRSYFIDLPHEKLVEHRDKLVRDLNISQNNLRLKIFRLRQRLEKCVAGKRILF